MEEYLKILPEELKKVIGITEQASIESGMPAYLVGGFLRDLLLGVKNFDLDIMVEGQGIVFARLLAQKLGCEIRAHERFGTATLILHGSLKIDIASARKEKYPCAAALPEVSCGLLKDDLARRDFTINAMAAGIGDKEKKLIDPFCGSKDLSAGKIRILHDLSFQDDPTRILRAIRFEQRLNFKIEPHTLFLLKEAVKKGFLNKVSRHRISDELMLMLSEKNPLKQIKRLSSLCGFSFINKKLKLNSSAYDFLKSVHREILWFKNNFPEYRKLDCWLIYFTALISSLALSEKKKIISGFGLKKGDEKRILSFYAEGLRLKKSLSKKGILPAKIFNALEPLSYETIILLKSTSKNKFLNGYIRNFLEIYNGMKLYVSGKDLANLGVLPGPEYQKIFSRVLEAKLNGKIKSHSQELSLIRNLIKINRNGDCDVKTREG